ncbi:hypothetical protein M3Y97_00057100 [Aphelenchoides bicaudatus]|nr:hypothetical protein M3Y97_00057100 [Aphelenchoides bicaudatus]
MTATDRTLKIVIVGDSFCGKTTLIYAYTQQTFLDEYEPTVFQNYAASVTINKKVYNLNLFDTTGQSEDKLSKLRIISYRNANVVMLCFSLIDKTSLENCKLKWIPEIRKHTNAPILLVGLKEDLIPSSPTHQVVDKKLAHRMNEDMECVKLLTCSALTHRNLKKVFDEALLLASTGHTTDSKPQMHWASICCSLF